MMPRPTKDEMLQDIDAALALRVRTPDEDHERLIEVGTALDACIRRNALPGSAYDDQADTARQRMQNSGWEQDGVAGYRGILRALRADVAADRIESIYGRISSAVLSDLLEQADALINDGEFSLPAAVLAGAALEEHIRSLCVKSGIPVELNGKPLKASVMNDELKKAAVYDEAQRKFVVAWQATRNDAAHAKAEFKNQTPAAIKLMIAGIRDFIGRHPL